MPYIKYGHDLGIEFSEQCVRVLQPEGIASPNPWRPYYLDLNDPKDASFKMKALDAATELRKNFQEQTLSLLQALTNSESRTSDSSGHKPRIFLTAEINQKRSFYVYWEPLQNGDGRYADFTFVPQVLNMHGVALGTVVRCTDEEWRSFGRSSYASEEAKMVTDALLDSMSLMLKTVATVADVFVLYWPEPSEKGIFEMTSPEDRLRSHLESRVRASKARMAPLKVELEQDFKRMGLSGVDQYKELKQAALTQNKRFTRHLFDTTGQRVTSLQTERFEERLTKWERWNDDLKKNQGWLGDLEKHGWQKVSPNPDELLALRKSSSKRGLRL